jgi:hypothetical protein
MSLETKSVEGQEWGYVECRAQHIRSGRQQGQPRGLFNDRFCRLIQCRIDLGGIDMIPGCGRPKLKTQLSAGRENENTPELPGITLDSGLSRPASQRTNRVSDQLRRRYLTMPATKLRSAIRMQIGIHEQQALYLELLAKRLGEAPISISYDHDFGALISPRLHRVTQLRDLLTTEESTKVAQEDENDGPVLPEITQTDRVVRYRVDQSDRRETGRNSHGDLLAGVVHPILAGRRLVSNRPWNKHPATLDLIRRST